MQQKEMSKLHVTRFLECPAVGRGGKQETKMGMCGKAGNATCDDPKYVETGLNDPKYAEIGLNNPKYAEIGPNDPKYGKRRLACSRLRYLCLSSLMSGAMGWRGRCCSTSSMFKLGRLAACQHLGENNWKHMNRMKTDQDMDVVRFMDHWATRAIGTRAGKDKTIRCGARFHHRMAPTTRPTATYC